VASASSKPDTARMCLCGEERRRLCLTEGRLERYAQKPERTPFFGQDGRNRASVEARMRLRSNLAAAFWGRRTRRVTDQESKDVQDVGLAT